MTFVDILKIDNTIRTFFNNEKAELQMYRNRLKETEESIKNVEKNPRLYNILIHSRNKLFEKIQDIEKSNSYNIYVSETSDIIHEYKTILKTPQHVSFCGKKVKRTSKRKKSYRNI